MKKSTAVKWFNDFEKAEPDVTINFSAGKAIANDFITRSMNTPLKEFNLAETENIAKDKNLFVNLAAPKN